MTTKKRKAKGTAAIEGWGVWVDDKFAGASPNRELARRYSAFRATSYETETRVRPIRITILEGKG